MSFNNGKNSSALGSGSGGVTLNITNSSTFSITLTGNVTFSFNGSTPGSDYSVNVLLLQDATGSRTVAWPGSVKWAAGTPAVLSTNPNKLDLVTLQTFDSGTTWYGTLTGNGFS